MTKRVSEEILNKMTIFGVDTIRFCQSVNLPDSVVDQIIKSATSIGANYSEAQNASSKKDFVNKIYISKKGASETRYWLNVVEGLVGSSEHLTSLQNTAQAQLMMLQKIINTSSASNRNMKQDNSSRRAK